MESMKRDILVFLTFLLGCAFIITACFDAWRPLGFLSLGLVLIGSAAQLVSRDK